MKFKINDEVQIIGTDDYEIVPFLYKIGYVVVAAEHENDLYTIELENGAWLEVFEEELELT